MKPFVDYYKENAISPVAQDISDLRKHFDRREALYRMLGIPPALLAGRSIVEFGPGSGFNSIYTASLQPARYVLVEGNPVGLARARELLGEPALQSRLAFVEALIDQFYTEERFDLVLCEGTIPFQRDPAAFLRHVASFAKPGGIIVITCNDSVSFQGEATRRLLADAVVAPGDSTPEKLAKLRAVFASHLATLEGMSRPVDDWILDNILQPLLPTTFSIVQAIAAIGDLAEFYGSSPDFVTDWRWYKQIVGARKRYNERAAAAYWTLLANFLDYRVVLAPHSEEFGRALYAKCHALIVCALDGALSPAQRLARAPAIIEEIAAAVAPLAAGSAQAYRALAAFLAHPEEAEVLAPFVPFFGRGQQYVSFMRALD